MEFQIAEAIELIKTLAETENLTQSQALSVFIAEASLDDEYASQLKAALFEVYTLQEMASDSLTTALRSVFVEGVEELQEVEQKETQEGTKYKVRVKDRASGSSYVRYATREKIAELRANPNISSVELTDHGTTGEDDRGERTAAAKGGGKDHDGDGKVESSSKEHAGVVHNAIQRKMGGRPDGQDTRKEEVEMEEGIDFKGAKRIDDARKKKQDEKDKKNPSGKDYRLALRKFRPGASHEERAEGHRDNMREKGTIPKKDGKKMFEAYLELRAAKKKLAEESVEEGYKGKHGQSDEEHMDSRSDAGKQISGDSKHSGAAYSHRSYKGVGKPAKPGERQEHQGKMTKADRDELAIRKSELKKKTQKEDFLPEADLVDAGRENSAQRDRKKLDGKDVDNSTSVKLMPHINEALSTKTTKSEDRLVAGSVNESLRAKIKEMAQVQEECCPKCGTPECTCEGKKEEKPKKKKAKLDEAGMPILETTATGPTKEMIAPEKDAEGPKGVKNPKGQPKKPQSGDRRPGVGTGKEIPTS